MKIVYNDPAAAQKRFIRIAWISYIVVVLLFTLRGMSVGQNVTTAIDGGLYSLIPLSGFFALIGLFFIPKSPWVSMVLLMGFLDGHGYFGMFGQYLGYMVAAPLFLLRSLVYFKQYG